MAEVVGVIWGSREAEYFCSRGWTGQITLKLLDKIADWRSAPDYDLTAPNKWVGPHERSHIERLSLFK